MRRLRRRLVVAVVLGAAALALILTLAIPTLRNAAASAVFKLALLEHGFALRSGAVRVSSGAVDVAGVEIDDGLHQPVFKAERVQVTLDPGVWLGRSDRRYGLIALDVERPTLYLVKLADGSYNVSSLFGTGAPAAAGFSQAPLRADIVLRNGTFDFADPGAPSIVGRHFAVNAIDLRARFDQGIFSTMRVRGEYAAGATRTPLAIDVIENDAARFAQARLHAGALYAAPIVDGLVPTRAFAVEDALLTRISLQAFSIGYDPAAGPDWQLSGSADLSRGRFRVLPLTDPVRDVSGRLMYAGGHLATHGLQGTLEGAPVVVRGGLRLAGGVRLALAVQSVQSLEQLKHGFVFSKKVAVSGPAAVDVRVEGPPANVDVAAQYQAVDTLSYGGLPLSAISGTLFYNGGHLTFPRVRGVYDDAFVSLSGDVDLSAVVTTGSFYAQATVPADRLPIAANFNPGGTARALLTLEGPLASMEGFGYADVTGGNGTLARSVVYAGPKRFAIGPMLVRDPRGGEFIGSAAIDRSAKIRTISSAIVARGANLHVVAGARSLPGVNDVAPIALPAIDGTLDGTVVVRGDERAPSAFVNAVAEDLTVSGTRLGHVVVSARGSNGRMHIDRVAIAGQDIVAHADGDAVIAPRAGRYAAVLQGAARANIASLSARATQARMQGTAAGTFAAALSGGHWTVALHATSDDASIAGVRVHTLDTSFGGGGGGPADVYAGTVGIAGGTVSAMGTMPAAAGPSGDLRIWTDGLDLRALSPSGARAGGGRAVVMAHVGGSFAMPVVSGAATVQNAVVGGQSFGGDLDVRYSADRLTANDGRIAIGGGFAEVNGTVSGLALGKPAGNAALSLDASMHEGDLGALAARYMPRSLHLQGTVSASLHVSGTVRSPHATGVVDSDSGTLQGVAFEGLHGQVAASPTQLQVSGASVGLGSSQFSFGGSISQSAVHIQASSAHVNLADFNDFFQGYDTLEGTGTGNIAFESTRTGVLGAGRVDVAHASLVGFPLGSLDVDFSSRRDQVLAHLRQTGDAGSSDLRGSVTFAPRRLALPDFRAARYDVNGTVRGADLGRITPLFGKENLGLTGLVDVNGFLRGNMRSPAGHADISLRDGHVGKVAITSASGTLDTDGRVVSVRNAAFTLPFAHVEGEGTIGPGRRIAASFGVDASDLGTIFALGGHPGVATGTALASVNASGTIAAPHVTTTIVSGRGTALGVGFDRLSGKVSYAPGEVDIADTQVDLAGNRGVIGIGGTLPLQLQPFGLGPKDKRVDLSLVARSVDVSAFDPLTTGLANLTGTLNATANVTGSAGRPQVTGAATLRGGSAWSVYETVAAQNIDADLSLVRDTLALKHLSASLGRGSLSGSGAVHIVPAVGLLNVAGLQYWTRVDLHDAQINVPGWTAGVLNGNLRLTKSGSVPFFSGDVTLDDGTVPFAAIYRLASGYGSGPQVVSGPLPGVPDLQPGHIVVYGGPVFGLGGPYVLSAAPGATPPPLQGPALPLVDLSVDARAGRNVRVHGGAIDLTAGGSVHIGGDLHAPTLAGTFTSTRGQIGYFDTNFRLVRGTVIFDPVEGLLPTLDVRAITNINGVEITLTVTGRVDNLQTDLSSNPALSRDEIVAQLLHAPQVASVISSTPGQAQSALYAEAQTYFNAQLSRSLLFPVESLLAQTINVEQISLIYDQQGKVDVEIRKLVTPTVFAIYRSSLNIPVTQTAGVAYSLRDYADLEILQTQSASGLQQSVLNLRFTFH